MVLIEIWTKDNIVLHYQTLIETRRDTERASTVHKIHNLHWQSKRITTEDMYVGK